MLCSFSLRRQSPTGRSGFSQAPGPSLSWAGCLRSSSTICSRADRSSSKASAACFSLFSLARSFSTEASRLWILPFATWRRKRRNEYGPALMAQEGLWYSCVLTEKAYGWLLSVLAEQEDFSQLPAGRWSQAPTNTEILQHLLHWCGHSGCRC